MMVMLPMIQQVEVQQIHIRDQGPADACPYEILQPDTMMSESRIE